MFTRGSGVEELPGQQSGSSEWHGKDGENVALKPQLRLHAFQMTILGLF